jgi:hypothetical protein
MTIGLAFTTEKLFPRLASALDSSMTHERLTESTHSSNSSSFCRTIHQIKLVDSPRTSWINIFGLVSSPAWPGMKQFLKSKVSRGGGAVIIVHCCFSTLFHNHFLPKLLPRPNTCLIFLSRHSRKFLKSPLGLREGSESCRGETADETENRGEPQRNSREFFCNVALFRNKT